MLNDVTRHPALLAEAEAMIAAGEAIPAMERILDPLIAWHEARFGQGAVSVRSPAHWRLLLDQYREAGKPVPSIAGPAWVLALYLTGQALLALKEPRAARQAFMAATRRSPVDAHSYAELGRIALMERRFDAALAGFEEAMELAEALSGGGEARLLAHCIKGRALALTGLKRTHDAEAAWARALAIDPLDWQARSELLKLGTPVALRRAA